MAIEEAEGLLLSAELAASDATAAYVRSTAIAAKARELQLGLEALHSSLDAALKHGDLLLTKISTTATVWRGNLSEAGVEQNAAHRELDTARQELAAGYQEQAIAEQARMQAQRERDTAIMGLTAARNALAAAHEAEQRATRELVAVREGLKRDHQKADLKQNESDLATPDIHLIARKEALLAQASVAVKAARAREMAAEANLEAAVASLKAAVVRHNRAQRRVAKAVDWVARAEARVARALRRVGLCLERCSRLAAMRDDAMLQLELVPEYRRLVDEVSFEECEAGEWSRRSVDAAQCAIDFASVALKEAHSTANAADAWLVEAYKFSCVTVKLHAIALRLVTGLLIYPTLPLATSNE
jgi:hypothetical protein